MDIDAIEIAALSVASGRRGYRGAAALILDERLTLDRVLRMFSFSRSKRLPADLSVIVLSAGVARYRAAPEGWSGARDRDLCGPTRRGNRNLRAAQTEAAKLVAERWHTITRLAESMQPIGEPRRVSGLQPATPIFGLGDAEIGEFHGCSLRP
jgi:hypothetical protein